jgi:hypothetical protein
MVGRLIAALSISATALMATSAGFWMSALLWAVPHMVAMRCLPLPAALALVLVTGVVGRALAFSSALDGWTLPLAATAALVPALLADRVLVTRWPTAGLWAWPVLAAATYMATHGSAVGELLAPMPELDGAHLLSAIHPALTVTVTSVIAQGFASMASVLNWHVPDPHEPRVRERGVRVAALVAFALLAAFAACGFLG